MCTAVVDERDDHRSIFFFQLKQLERRSLKKIRASSFQLLKLEKTYCDDDLFHQKKTVPITFPNIGTPDGKL